MIYLVSMSNRSDVKTLETEIERLRDALKRILEFSEDMYAIKQAHLALEATSEYHSSEE